MIAIVLFIFLIIWILLTKFAMKTGRLLLRRFRPDNPRAEKCGAFWGFMLAMGWVLVYWTVEAVVVRIYAAQMCKQAGITVYVTPEQWRSLTKESADNLRKNAPFSFKKNVSFPFKEDSIIFDGHEFQFSYSSSLSNDIYVYTFVPPKKNYTFMHYQIYFDKKFQVILFKNLYVYTRSAPGGNLSFKFWIDSTPRCDSDAFKYFSQYYLISQPTVKR